MLDKKNKGIIAFFLLCNILLLVVFLIEFLCYQDMLTLPDPFFRQWTDWEWEMFTQSSKGDNGIIMLSEIVGFTVSVINLIGIHILLFGRIYGHVILPIRKVWKIVIPLIGLLLYLPCFYYIKYLADYCHLYMELVPALFLSFILLALGIVGLVSLQKQKQ